MWVFNCLGRLAKSGWFGQHWNCSPNWQQFPQQRIIFLINFQQDTQIRKSWGHPSLNQKNMLVQVNDYKSSWIWIIKHIFLINEETLLNILDTFLCKIMKRKMKCIFELCAAIWQEFGHPKIGPLYHCHTQLNVCEKEGLQCFSYLIQIFVLDQIWLDLSIHFWHSQPTFAYEF